MHRFASRPLAIAFVAIAALIAAACSGTDDGASVREIGETSESVSASGSASASASASAPASDDSASTPGDGGYEYASNVDSHRLVVADICGIGDLLDAGDFTAVEDTYRNGENSVKSDGSIRTIGGFAARDDRSHGLDAYYGTPAPLDSFVTAALQGTGIFEGHSDGVRAQGAEKGIQNQVMVAWTVHELYSAIGKAKDGNFDVASGAVHNWDEGWAFFHGAEPGCAPYATGNKRAGNFGTVGADGETALANEAILAAMIAGRDALARFRRRRCGGGRGPGRSRQSGHHLLAGSHPLRQPDRGRPCRRQRRQGQGAPGRGLGLLAGGGGLHGPRRCRRRRRWTPIFNLDNPPGANGFGDEVRAALEPAWDALGIAASDIGSLQ